MNYKRLVRLGLDWKIEVPKEFCEVLRIYCGDFLVMEVEDGKLVLSPKLLIRGEITLSKAGEEKLNEALNDIEKGRIEKA